MKTIPQFGLLLAILLGIGTASTRADEVTDWNQNMLNAVFVAGISPPAASRVAAIVHSSVFDAVNGIERRYTAVHVQPGATPGASIRAAAVQAAYASLTNLFPVQKPTFDAELAASLAAISSGGAAESSQSIALGVQWGQTVAEAILLWRSTDGFTRAFDPFTGGTAVGQWRPTPPGFGPGAALPFAYMTPWVIKSPSQFRPGGPPALLSHQYAEDFNETKLMGSASSLIRTPDETIACQFWQSTTWTYFWNHIAVSIASERHTTLSENARLLALLNISIADAAIACFDAKYTYVFWRPVTAIPLGDTVANPATIGDLTWTPLLDTPGHPEYPSAHSTASGAAAEVLAAYFGDGTSFTANSDDPSTAGVTRSFSSFSDSLEEIKNARVFAGIHFRSACDDGRDTGRAVADYVMANVVQKRADEVLDWNAVLLRSGVATFGAPGFRLAAIVQASVFDAVNGIDRQFTPIHVSSQAPGGASRRAAAVQAAYTALVALFPAQTAAFDQDLATSLAGIAVDAPAETSESIALGRAWGGQVANEILAWRSTDGFDPSPSTYTGSLLLGKWRPTPPALANGLAPSLAHTLPWVIPSPSSFRPPGQPDLTSTNYTADFNEEKAIGETNSIVRTADQTQAARFWAGTALNFWNRAAATAALQRHSTLLENARLFALLGTATADAATSCWDAKYRYEFWRPITAIRLASTDGNPDTAEQADWTPLIITPPYPEYSSGHATVSGAAQTVLTSYFGNNQPVEGWSEAFGEATVRSWPSFSAAADEANLARIWAGIHFRTAVVDGRAAGNAIGAYVMANAAQERRKDIILQHTDGSVAFWTMNGTTIVDGIVANTIPAGWRIVGAGDFNHDDQSDLVLQHTDGSVAFWLMHGTTITQGIVLFAVPEGWRIVATGDFNNDTQVDLVLQNEDGLIAFWFMDGTSVVGTQLSYQLPAGWRVAGTGRFDHNGATDLVLQHTDGSVAFWLMDGTTILNGVVGDQIPSAWQIVGTGNYNSGNDTDIVLQHTDGSVAFWLMDGTTIAHGVAPYVLPAGWQIVGPR